MTVSTMRPTADARPRPRLTCSWVPVRGTDGQTRMEMRWIDETQPARRTTRHAA